MEEDKRGLPADCQFVCELQTTSLTKVVEYLEAAAVLGLYWNMWLDRRPWAELKADYPHLRTSKNASDGVLIDVNVINLWARSPVTEEMSDDQ